jgi:hypothetical protein
MNQQLSWRPPQRYWPASPYQCPYFHQGRGVPYPAVVQPAPKRKGRWFFPFPRLRRRSLTPVIRSRSVQPAGKPVSPQQGNRDALVTFYSPGGFAFFV